MMKNKSNIHLLLAILLALLSVGAFVVGVKYVNGLKEKTLNLKEEIESSELRINRAQSMHKSDENTSEDRVKILNYFVKADSAIDFVSDLEATASDLRLIYVTNSIENSDIEVLKSQDKEVLHIKMTLTGGWKNIIRFLSYVESLPYAVNIEKISLVSEGIKKSNTVDTTADKTADNAGDKIVTSSNTEISNWKLDISFSVIKIKEVK